MVECPRDWYDIGDTLMSLSEMDCLGAILDLAVGNLEGKMPDYLVCAVVKYVHGVTEPHYPVPAQYK